MTQGDRVILGVTDCSMTIFLDNVLHAKLINDTPDKALCRLLHLKLLPEIQLAVGSVESAVADSWLFCGQQ